MNGAAMRAVHARLDLPARERRPPAIAESIFMGPTTKPRVQGAAVAGPCRRQADRHGGNQKTLSQDHDRPPGG